MTIRITTADAARLLDDLTLLVSRAGAAILAARESGLDVRAKADESPVTAADLAADAVICEGLARLMPGLPVVSEESATQLASPIDGSFALVDPLDGTKEFVAGRNEFTVNLALMTDGSPLLGIIAAPADGLIWRGIVGAGAERLVLAPGAAVGEARERRPIKTAPWPSGAVRAVVSRSHLDPQTKALVARLPQIEHVSAGSSLKLCRLAEGSADLYPRLSPLMEWDLAAGHGLVEAAGGSVTTPEGRPLNYGQSVERRIPAFIALGDPSARAKLGL